MNRFLKIGGRFAALALLFLIPGIAHAQSIQASATVPLTLTSAESISVSTDHPGGATFAPSGADYATSMITATATWNLASNRTTGDVCQALTLGTLPGAASNYFYSSGGSSTFFGQAGASANCSSLTGIGTIAPDIADLNFSGANGFHGSAQYTFTLTTSGLGTVPVGSYTGTYTIVLFVS